MTNQQPRPISSLYIGDLPNDATEALLFEKFSQFGKVISIRICRRRDNNQPLGYAYVNYERDEDAVQAIETLNLTELNGKFIRVMRCQRDPSARKSGKANLFIKNLHPSITDRELFDTFSPFGEIMSCKIARDDLSVNRGYGFVQFMDEASAETAINVLNGKMVRDKIIYVGRFHFRNELSKETEKKESDDNFTNCYVKNLSEEDTDESLQELFAKFGEIVSIKVMRDEDARSKCFAFVNFKDHSAATNAVSELNGRPYKDKTLYISRAQSKTERQTFTNNSPKNEVLPDCLLQDESVSINSIANNLYLKNLDDVVDDERLRYEFATFGVITSAKVMVDENGRSKGFGFVSFKSAQSAVKAMEVMGGKPLEGKPLYISFAQKKEDRRKILTRQYHNRLRQIHNHSPAQPNLTHYTPPGIIYNQYHLPNGMPARPQTIGDIRPILYPPGNIGMTHVRHIVPGNIMQSTCSMPEPTVITKFPNTREGEDISMKDRRFTQAHPPVNVEHGNLVKCSNPPSTSNAALPLTHDMLVNAPPQEQKQMLGERIFPLVYEWYPEKAGKVTGMLLEIETGVLLKLLQETGALREKVEEARHVLDEHEKVYSSRGMKQSAK